MAEVLLSKIFKDKYLDMIMDYKQTIQVILKSYDVVIFMARKAICLYHSLKLNGDVCEPSSCKVISSRVTDYNVFDSFIDKKIAIIDDVVVKGLSLNRVIAEFNKRNIHADVYVAACEKQKIENVLKENNFRLSNIPYYLNESEIYIFSGLITKYIEVSMCSFNIDHPIYENAGNIDTIRTLIAGLPTFTLTTDSQRKYGINSAVLYVQYDSFDNAEVKKVLDRSILKIRFLYNNNKMYAIPFVLFPKLTFNELNVLYKYIHLQNTGFIEHPQHERMTDENILKVLSCYFSDLLFQDFIDENLFKRDYTIDIYRFSDSTENVYQENLTKKMGTKMQRVISYKHPSGDLFSFSKYFGYAIEYISTIEPKTQNYTNAFHTKIKEKIVDFTGLSHYIKSFSPIKDDVTSSVIDILIDYGMIVPSIVHCEEYILRAY